MLMTWTQHVGWLLGQLIQWAWKWWSRLNMAHVGKRLKKAHQAIDSGKVYLLEEAVKLVKANATAKFDETIEIAINLNVDSRKADQNVRGVVQLPNGTGKNYRRKGANHREIYR